MRRSTATRPNPGVAGRDPRAQTRRARAANGAKAAPDDARRQVTNHPRTRRQPPDGNRVALPTEGDPRADANLFRI